MLIFVIDHHIGIRIVLFNCRDCCKPTGLFSDDLRLPSTVYGINGIGSHKSNTCKASIINLHIQNGYRLVLNDNSGGINNSDLNVGRSIDL